MTRIAKANSTGSHRNLGQLRAIYSSANDIHVHKDGSDSLGNGSDLFPYLTIVRGIEDVTAARVNMFVGSGEFDETALTWPTISGFKLFGSGTMWQTVIKDSSGSAEVISVAPGVQTGTFTMFMQNVQIEHANGQNGLHLNNTDMTKKLNCQLGHVGMDGESDDFSLLVTHADTDNAVRVYWDDDNGGVAGEIDLNGANAGDRFFAKNINFSGDEFAFGGDIASTVKLTNCQFTHEMFTGGGATSTVVALIWSTSDNSGTYEAADATDVTANSTVNTPQIVGT